MKTVKAILKQLFGAHYEHIRQSLFICLILYFSLSAAEVKAAAAPFIFYLTTTVFTAGVMWQALCSPQNADRMAGLFMLPFENQALTFSYVTAFSIYTLLTKTSVVLALFLAVGHWNIDQLFTVMLCACNSCMMSAACYAMIKQRRWLPALLWILGVALFIFLVRQPSAFLSLIALSLTLALLYLSLTDAYTFYHSKNAAILIRHRHNRGTGSIRIYLFRYLAANKSYLINTLGLLTIAIFLPELLGQFKGLNAMPLGFPILCLNTPLCILLSCDPKLEQAVRTLPNQAFQFCSHYCLFLFWVNVVVDLVYLASWKLQIGKLDKWELLFAVLFSAQSAIFSVLLEWLAPIRNWKIENDLWHHPRKYIVPLAMMLMAAVVSAWPVMAIPWLCALITEIIVLLLIARNERSFTA